MASPLFPRPKIPGTVNPALGNRFDPSPYPEGFGPAPPEKPVFQTPKLNMQAPKPEEENDIANYLNLYKPDTRATDMFMDLMEHVPERNQPSKWRRAGAGLVALGEGGMEAADKVLYDPYYKKLGDFKLRADLLKDLASAERSGNVNERLMLQSLLRQGVLERQQTTREGELQRKQKSDEARNEIGRIRARLAEIREDKTLSDEQKIALQGKYAQDLARLRGDISAGLIGERAELDQDLERLRQTGRISLEEKRGEETRTTNVAKVTGEAAKPELPTQTKVRQYNIAREIYNSDPDAKRFIKLGAPGTNDFQITPRSAWTAKGKEEYLKKYDELVGKIYGTKAPAAAPPVTKRTPKTAADVLPPGGPAATKTTTSKQTLTRKVRGSKIGVVTATSEDGGKTWKLPDGRILQGNQ